MNFVWYGSYESCQLILLQYRLGASCVTVQYRHGASCVTVQCCHGVSYVTVQYRHSASCVKVLYRHSHIITTQKQSWTWNAGFCLIVLLALCDPGGSPKGPQFSISPNALQWMFKSCWNVFDCLYIDFMKIFTQKFRKTNSAGGATLGYTSWARLII